MKKFKTNDLLDYDNLTKVLEKICEEGGVITGCEISREALVQHIEENVIDCENEEIKQYLDNL